MLKGPHILFNYVIDWIMTKAIAEYRGVQLSSDTWISDIGYGEDVVILAENLENLIFILECVNYFSDHIKLEINLSKTKVLSTCSSAGLAPALSGTILEEVPVFKYVGSHLQPSHIIITDMNISGKH